MPTMVTKFESETGSTSNYTSKVVYTLDNRSGSGATKLDGLLQMEIEDGSSIKLEGRLSDDAPWQQSNEFKSSEIVLVHLAPQLRIKVEGRASAWIAEVR